MRKVLASLVLLAAVAAAQSTSVDVAPLTVITAANLFDGRTVTHNRAVLVRGNKIIAVTGLDNADVKSAPARIAFGPEVTVMPGMIESHTHIFLQGEAPEDGGYDANLLFGGVYYRAARATMSLRRALDQ